MAYISVTIILLVIIDTVILYVYRGKQYGRHMENEILKMQLQQEQSMYQKINKIYEESQIMRHDLKHYLSVVLGLIVNEEYKEAEDFIIEIIGKRFESKVVRYQGSNVINAVLNDKQNMCENAGIDFRISISGDIPKQHELNLAIILANLLDNAIEAQKNVEEKKIWLNIQEQKGMLYIIVKNKISGSVLEENPDMQTTKKDKKQHGFGRNSVRDLVKEMDGSFQQYEESDCFMSYITVPFGE